MADYSINPQFANLTGLQPLQSIDVTRGGSLQFQPLQQIQVVSSQPELVAQGIANAIQGIGQGALSGITAKWEKEESLAKEQRKYAQELELEAAKQQTKNKSFIDELKLKTASEHGLEADLPERMAQIDKAAERLDFVVPSGYTPKEKPVKKLTPAQLIPAPVEVDLPVKSDYQETIVSAANQAPPAIVTPPLQPPTTVATPESAALAEINIPAPDLTKAKAASPILSSVPPIGAAVSASIPEQPQDPKMPRNLSGLLFGTQDASTAFETAAKLTTPYRKVIAEQDARTKEWYLKQEDTSSEVEKAQVEAEKLGISKEDLVLRKRQDEREAAKAEAERIEVQRKRLKEDNLLLKTQKNNIQTEANKLSFIDRAIQSIQSEPELVGIMSQYYLGDQKLPFAPGTYKDWAIIGKQLGYNLPVEKIQKIVDIQENLKTIESNLGWQAFGQMKELSPTGSAGVGGLTEGERQSLERIPGSLSITQSPKNLLNNLYNLKNGAVKTIENASSEVSQIDKTFQKPIISSLKMNPDEQERIKFLSTELGKATEEQKKDQNYLDALEELKNLIRQKNRLDEFNQQFRSIK
jgi:hypothetical protein